MCDEQQALETLSYSSMNTAIVLQKCHSLRLIDFLKKQSYTVIDGFTSVKEHGDWKKKKKYPCIKEKLRKQRQTRKNT